MTTTSSFETIKKYWKHRMEGDVLIIPSPSQVQSLLDYRRIAEKYHDVHVARRCDSSGHWRIEVRHSA